ncbi:hypothetical protein AZH53_06180 [Methanomicrobiaceae archaeon CYW5]|nr:hypothetical protein [Methanovulcanius yangii]
MVVLGLKNNLSTQMDKATRGINKNALAIGAAMTGVGIAAAAMVSDINSTFMDFDTAMAQVKSLGGVTVEQMEAMEDAAISISKQLPISADEVAEGFYMMRSAGYSAEEAIAGIPAIADMAVAGNLDMAEAVDATTMVLDVYGDRAGDASHITDVLIGTVQDFKTTLPELQQELSKNIGVASTLGISFEELAAMNGMLKKDFTSSEEAGTAMKTMLMSLADETKQSKLADLGIAVKDAQGNFIGMESVLAGLGDALDDAGGNVEQMSIMQDIFGAYGVRAAMSLSRQSDELDDYASAVGESGAVQSALQAQLDTTASKTEIAENKMNAAKIALGEGMAPATAAAAGAVGIFADGLAGLPAPLQTVAGLGIFGAQGLAPLGPLMMLLSTTSIPSLGGALMTLAANPVVLIIAGIVALGLGLYALEKKFGVVSKAVDWVKARIMGFVDWLKGDGEGGILGFGDNLLLLLGPIGWVIYAFKNWEQIAETVTGVFDSIKNIILGAIDWLANAGSLMMDALVDGILTGKSPASAILSGFGAIGELIFDQNTVTPTPAPAASSGAAGGTVDQSITIVNPTISSPDDIDKLMTEIGSAQRQQRFRAGVSH